MHSNSIYPHLNKINYFSITLAFQIGKHACGYTFSCSEKKSFLQSLASQSTFFRGWNSSTDKLAQNH